ncbi:MULTISPECIES: AAA family ATPase [unclassified Lactococcus]|uniref:AAA family ATPase n=1 Tax=unclassified Lactococcus TaxID=2643510 RepID=UPI0011CBED6B|nr:MULTISPECIES: AAA family ATPase [unclassified Lactococcus]MQW22783.1 ATP-binding cassette domain-containing protein [Lactococcus sp. dk101]TXK44787.1 ATP-binding cassette domain-containing protein [Lactococcus sp. dk310]TXK50681.1 ATP-binding cassette domain-containing protein [Lactococcus sp. dk322]
MELKIENLKLPEISAFDFEIIENGLYGIIGKNGIGKSTLFSVLSDEVSISQGNIKKGRAAYLADIEIFDKTLKMEDYFSILKKNERENAEQLLKKFEANKFEKKKIEKFSLGMKELFATILSFSIDCEILIIDELFSGLDISKKAKVYEEIQKISKEKIVLLTSHNLKEIEHFCDKTYILTENGLNLVTDFDKAAREIGYMDLFF